MIADDDVDPGWKAWTSIFLGSCYLEMGDSDSARKTFEHVKDAYPNTEFSQAAQRYLDNVDRRHSAGGQ